MIDKLNDDWWQTESLYFQDLGREENKTRTWKVMTKQKFMLGTIKWLSMGHTYGFVSKENRPLLPRYLLQIAEFATARTLSRPGRVAEIRAKKAIQKEKYLQRRLQKDLTNKENCDTVVINEVVQPENGLVEGVKQAETPLVS